MFFQVSKFSAFYHWSHSLCSVTQTSFLLSLASKPEVKIHILLCVSRVTNSGLKPLQFLSCHISQSSGWTHSRADKSHCMRREGLVQKQLNCLINGLATGLLTDSVGQNESVNEKKKKTSLVSLDVRHAVLTHPERLLSDYWTALAEVHPPQPCPVTSWVKSWQNQQHDGWWQQLFALLHFFHWFIYPKFEQTTHQSYFKW